MDIRLVLIIVFILIMTVIAIAYRKSTLDKLVMLPGEEVLFEEPGIKVEQRGGPRTAVFPGCTVLVTNQRIIIAQKVPFSRKPVLKHVITYHFVNRGTDLSQTFKKGYLIMEVDKSMIRFEDDTSGTTVTIDVPDSALTRGQYLTFKTAKGEDFKHVLG